ncbi:hypothetical protein BS78_08G164700 [Paspalum vaginatum]|nr:hypothetical protein BS78_08G164700 [Paspalum vaginatum]
MHVTSSVFSLSHSCSFLSAFSSSWPRPVPAGLRRSPVAASPIFGSSSGPCPPASAALLWRRRWEARRIASLPLCNRRLDVKSRRSKVSSGRPQVMDQMGTTRHQRTETRWMNSRRHSLWQKRRQSVFRFKIFIKLNNRLKPRPWQGPLPLPRVSLPRTSADVVEAASHSSTASLSRKSKVLPAWSPVRTGLSLATGDDATPRAEIGREDFPALLLPKLNLNHNKPIRLVNGRVEIGPNMWFWPMKGLAKFSSRTCFGHRNPRQAPSLQHSLLRRPSYASVVSARTSLSMAANGSKMNNGALNAQGTGGPGTLQRQNQAFNPGFNAGYVRGGFQGRSHQVCRGGYTGGQGRRGRGGGGGRGYGGHDRYGYDQGRRFHGGVDFDVGHRWNNAGHGVYAQFMGGGHEGQGFAAKQSQGRPATIQAHAAPPGQDNVITQQGNASAHFQPKSGMSPAVVAEGMAHADARAGCGDVTEGSDMQIDTESFAQVTTKLGPKNKKPYCYRCSQKGISTLTA